MIWHLKSRYVGKCVMNWSAWAQSSSQTSDVENNDHTQLLSKDGWEKVKVRQRLALSVGKLKETLLSLDLGESVIAFPNSCLPPPRPTP